MCPANLNLNPLVLQQICFLTLTLFQQLVNELRLHLIELIYNQ